MIPAFGRTFLNSKRRIKTLKVCRGHLVDHFASFLYASGLIPQDQEIGDIEFTDLTKEKVTLKIYIDKEV